MRRPRSLRRRHQFLNIPRRPSCLFNSEPCPADRSRQSTKGQEQRRRHPGKRVLRLQRTLSSRTRSGQRRSFRKPLISPATWSSSIRRFRTGEPTANTSFLIRLDMPITFGVVVVPALSQRRSDAGQPERFPEASIAPEQWALDQHLGVKRWCFSEVTAADAGDADTGATMTPCSPGRQK